MKRSVRNAVLLVSSLGLIVAACGESTTSGSAPGPGTGVGAPDPNAPEANGAGDIPDNQVYVAFSPPGNRFTVSVPEGWSRSTAGTATVFTDKFNSVGIDTVSRAQEPSQSSVTAEELPALQSATPGYVPGAVTSVRRSAGPAILVTYQATSPPDPVTGKSVTDAVERYEFWHNGEEVIVTLSGPKDADNVDPWRTITDSLRWQG